VNKGHQRRRAATDLIGQGRQTERHALLGVALGLPVERLMLVKLLEQHHRQQAGSGPASRDDVERRRSLADLLAPVPVADRVARSFVPRECFGDLACNPLCRRLGGDVDPDEISAVEPDDDKGVRQVEAEQPAFNSGINPQSHATGSPPAPIGEVTRFTSASPQARINPSISLRRTLRGGRRFAFEPAVRRWMWDGPRIASRSLTDNVVELMIKKIMRLPAACREALRVMACIGNTVRVDALAAALDVSVSDVDVSVRHAVDAGLVTLQSGAYTVLHDRIQEASYALIAEADRPSVHLRVGRRLFAWTPPEKLDENVFEIVNQLNRGIELVGDRDELDRIAELNAKAGQRAKAATANATALALLRTGAAVLGDSGWQRHRALAFTFAFERAECEFLMGDLEQAEAGLSALVARAEGPRELAAVACLRMMLYVTRDEHRRPVLGSAKNPRRTSPSRHRHRPDQRRQVHGRRWSPRRDGRPSFATIRMAFVAMGLFVVPTISFWLLYSLVIMRDGRRQILWLGVTAHPTAEWIADQLTEACGWEQISRY